MRDLPELFISAGIIVLMGALLLCGYTAIQAADLHWFENVQVVVSVDNRVVYKGINGCVTVESSGATTTVKTYGGFLCWWPTGSFTSKNVEVRGDKR